MINLENSTVDLDISNKCTLECNRCERQELRSLNMDVPGGDMSVDDFIKVCDYYGSDENYIAFCGPISDPIFNPNILEFLKIAYEKNKRVKIHTAATSKNKKIDWYEKAFDINPNARWIFGLDGLPNKSWIYRVNQDSDLIYDAMILCAKKNMDVIWQYLVFGYNEDQIEEAKDIAENNNITLEINHTSRYIDHDIYKPTNDVVNERKKTVEYGFYPRCLSNNRPPYVSATGQILPCCWADQPTVNLLKNDPVLATLNREDFNIKNVENIKDVYKHEVYEKFYNDLINNHDSCSEYCKKKCSQKMENPTRIKKRYGKLSRKS